jgi:hypothetical protein
VVLQSLFTCAVCGCGAAYHLNLSQRKKVAAWRGRRSLSQQFQTIPMLEIVITVSQTTDNAKAWGLAEINLVICGLKFLETFSV